MPLESLRTNLASAWNGVRSGRLASFAAVVALALGSGAGITASAIAYTGLIRPIPLPDAGRLVTLKRTFAPTGITSGIKLVDFDRCRAEVSSTLDLAAYAAERATLRDAAGPKEIQAGYVAGA